VTCEDSIRCLRPRGRHVQVGLLPPAQGRPAVPMDLVVARELQVLGSHGMAAHTYPELLGLITAGRLRPQTLVTRELALDEAGAAAAAGHLLELGHRRLGVLTAPLQADGFQGIADANRQRRATYDVMAARLAGVRRVAAEAGLSWSDVPVVESALSDVDAGALGTWELLDRPRPPTALLAFSDPLAIGALRAAAELGIPVPRRLSVVGFDDIASAATTEPALTTVAQPLRQRGEMAGELVRLQLDGRRAPEPSRLPVELVIRASTGAVPPGSH